MQWPSGRQTHTHTCSRKFSKLVFGFAWYLHHPAPFPLHSRSHALFYSVLLICLTCHIISNSLFAPMALSLFVNRLNIIITTWSESNHRNSLKTHFFFFSLHIYFQELCHKPPNWRIDLIIIPVICEQLKWCFAKRSTQNNICNAMLFNKMGRQWLTLL